MTRQRNGYTLIELLAATASAGLLVAGLSSVLFISVRALNMGDGAVAAQLEASAAMDRVLTDMHSALSFTERTSQAVEFTVPDITGDGLVDSLRYEWSGVEGAPLLRSLNGGEPVPLMKSVEKLTFRFLDRSVEATDVTAAPNP